MVTLQVKVSEETSDGYHTFKELYDHRHWLFINLAHRLRNDAWKSNYHDDGTKFTGMFIAGITTKNGLQITYHLPQKLWPKLHVKKLDKAPKWDGHTSQDVVERLKKLTK